MADTDNFIPMQMEWTPDENEVLQRLASKAGVSESELMVTALRLYQTRAEPVDLGSKLNPDVRPISLAGLNMLADEDYDAMMAGLKLDGLIR